MENSVDKIAASVSFQNFWIHAKHNASAKFSFYGYCHGHVGQKVASRGP